MQLRAGGPTLGPVSNPYPLLRSVARAEGISWLALLFVAMPLKYFAGMPLAVTIVGAAHGGLFLAFLVVWQRTWVLAGWSVAQAGLLFLSALLPFGPLFVAAPLRRLEQEFLQRQP